MSCNGTQALPLALTSDSAFAGEAADSEKIRISSFLVTCMIVVLILALAVLVTYCATVARHQGLVTLLPKGLVAALERPVFETLAEVHARVIWFGNNVARVFLLVSMDLDDSQRRDVLHGVDRNVHRRVFQLPLVQLLPFGLQRILFGPSWRDEGKLREDLTLNESNLSPPPPASVAMAVAREHARKEHHTFASERFQSPRAAADKRTQDAKAEEIMTEPQPKGAEKANAAAAVQHQQHQHSDLDRSPRGKSSQLHQVVAEKVLETALTTFTPRMFISALRCSTPLRASGLQNSAGPSAGVLRWLQHIGMRLRSYLHWALNGIDLRTFLTSALGCGLCVGAIGGIIGFGIGGFIGAVGGSFLALFTLGFSIPIGFAAGSSVGFCIGISVGGCAGFLGGGTAYYLAVCYGGSQKSSRQSVKSWTDEVYPASEKLSAEHENEMLDCSDLCSRGGSATPPRRRL